MPTTQAKPLFSLGRTLATPGALAEMEKAGIVPFTLLARHSCGDWGDLDGEDKQANDDDLLHGGRIFSAYVVGGVKFWVITEADRSSTTILFTGRILTTTARAGANAFSGFTHELINR